MASTTRSALQRVSLSDAISDLFATSVHFEHEFNDAGRHRLTYLGVLVGTMKHGEWTDYRSPATVRSSDESIQFAVFTEYWIDTFDPDTVYVISPLKRPVREA